MFLRTFAEYSPVSLFSHAHTRATLGGLHWIESGSNNGNQRCRVTRERRTWKRKRKPRNALEVTNWRRAQSSIVIAAGRTAESRSLSVLWHDKYVSYLLQIDLYLFVHAILYRYATQRFHRQYVSSVIRDILFRRGKAPPRIFPSFLPTMRAVSTANIFLQPRDSSCALPAFGDLNALWSPSWIPWSRYRPRATGSAIEVDSLIVRAPLMRRDRRSGTYKVIFQSHWKVPMKY